MKGQVHILDAVVSTIIFLSLIFFIFHYLSNSLSYPEYSIYQVLRSSLDVAGNPSSDCSVFVNDTVTGTALTRRCLGIDREKIAEGKINEASVYVHMLDNSTVLEWHSDNNSVSLNNKFILSNYYVFKGNAYKITIAVDTVD